MVEPNASRFGPLFGSAIVNASGIATVQFQATQYKMQVDQVTVKQTSGTPILESIASVYKNIVSTSNLIDVTYTGSSGDRTSDDLYLEQGDSVIIVWTGADVGAIMTCTIAGWQSVPDRGFRAFH